MAAVWGFIFLGVVAAYGLWNDVQRQTTGNQMLELGNGQIIVPRQSDGHYYLTLALNGENIRFVVDTGATDMVLTREDARRAGLDPDTLNFIGTANTANGQVRTAPVRLDTVRLGEFTDTDVFASVNGGEMFGSLLGMGYLEKWGRIEISGGELRLTR
jgi:aspartyl protease family protein